MYYNSANFPWQEYCADHSGMTINWGWNHYLASTKTWRADVDAGTTGVYDFPGFSQHWLEYAYDHPNEAYTMAWTNYYYSTHTWLADVHGGQITYLTLASFPWEAYLEHVPGAGSDAATVYEHYKTYLPRWIKEPTGSDYRWYCGPEINGVEYSPGCPDSFLSCFFIPRQGEGRVGYVTTSFGGESLQPYSLMKLRFRIETAPGTWFYGWEDGGPGRVALYFQRSGDDWSTEKYNAGYRCWSHARTNIVNGEHTMQVSLTDYTKWTGSSSQSEFDASKNNCARMGFTFSGSQSAGHGMACTDGAGGGWGKFTLLEYSLIT